MFISKSVFLQIYAILCIALCFTSLKHQFISYQIVPHLIVIQCVDKLIIINVDKMTKLGRAANARTNQTAVRRGLRVSETIQHTLPRSSSEEVVGKPLQLDVTHSEHFR